MSGYLRSAGSRGIHPCASPAWYAHSSAFSAFHVHCTHPAPPRSNVLACASQYFRRNALYSSLKDAAGPVRLAHDSPTRVEEVPGYVPS